MSSNEQAAGSGSQGNGTQQERQDGSGVIDNTSGQGAASAYARFKSQREQQAQLDPQDATRGRGQ